MEITFPNLASINDGVSLSFNDQLWSAATIYKNYCYEGASTGAAEVYPRLEMLPGLREWIGDRVVRSLTNVTFTITNRSFEETIGIKRTDIEDDKFGLLTPVAQELGNNAGRFPDLLTAQLMKAGHTTICYDGQNFFDTAHPTYDANGNAITLANYASGSSPVWYLFDVSRALKPVIWQRRRPFQVIPKFSMTDPQVFWNQEYEWGVDGRCNAGFGIWQLGFMSTQALTLENLLAARTLMAQYRRPDGAPMGIRGTLIVTGSNNYPTAKALAEDDMIPNTYSSTYVTSTTVTLLPNPARGLFKALENEWLN